MKAAVFAVWRWLHMAYLRFHINSTERYIEECKRDGIMGTETLRHWAQQLDAHRAQLATIEGKKSWG